jgi:hypothetical protein
MARSLAGAAAIASLAAAGIAVSPVGAVGPRVELFSGLSGANRGIAVAPDGSEFALKKDSDALAHLSVVDRAGASLMDGPTGAGEYISEFLVDPKTGRYLMSWYSRSAFTWFAPSKDGVAHSVELTRGQIRAMSFDPTGERLYVATNAARGEAVAIFRNDGGYTYERSIDLDYGDLAYGSVTSIDIDAAGNLYVATHDANHAQIPTSYFLKRFPNGTWAKFSTGVVNGVYTTTVRVDHRGRVYVNFRNSTAVAVFTPSNPAGTAYQGPEWIRTASVGYTDAMDLDAAGNMYTEASNGGSATISTYAYTRQAVTGAHLDCSAAAGAAKSGQLAGWAVPVAAENPAVRWASSSPAVVTVSATGAFAKAAPGTATITLTTTEGGHTATCRIAVPKAGAGSSTVTGSIPGVTVSPVADKAYTGKQVKPAVAVRTTAGAKLKANTDYTLAYGKNKAIGQGSVKITAKGKYSGVVTATFKIVPKKLAAPKATAGAKRLKVTWKPASKAQKVTAYQVRYKAKGAAKWKTKTVAAKKTGVTLKKLKAGKAYQVQVRARKTVGAVKYAGAWSKTKTSKKVK